MRAAARTSGKERALDYILAKYPGYKITRLHQLKVKGLLWYSTLIDDVEEIRSLLAKGQDPQGFEIQAINLELTDSEGFNKFTDFYFNHIAMKMLDAEVGSENQELEIVARKVEEIRNPKGELTGWKYDVLETREGRTTGNKYSILIDDEREGLLRVLEDYLKTARE